MATTIANFTLPAVCHVVCTIVATGISGINVTDSALSQSPIFPEGYIAHPDIGFAYKVHDENVTAIEARRRCTEEGGQLALIDSAKKLDYVWHQKHTSNYAHVGIVLMYDDSTWAATSTGMPVSSLPWQGGYPETVEGRRYCVFVNFEGNGLENYACTSEVNYVCELPIFERTSEADTNQ